MNFDLVLGGVGGQGILSIAFVLDNTALKQGLHFKQSEVHGMAQRGGAVSSFLRISDQVIYSDLVAKGSAHMVLGVEPMEAIRYLDYLAPSGRIVSSTSPEVNIPDYPELEAVLTALLEVPGTVLLNGKKVAKEAGSHRAENMVVLGAAAPHIPLEQSVMESFIEVLFGRKGEKVVNANLNAFRYGCKTGLFFRSCLEQGAKPSALLALMDHLESATLEPEAAARWCEVLSAPVAAELSARWQAEPKLTIAGSGTMAAELLRAGLKALPTATN